MKTFQKDKNPIALENNIEINKPEDYFKE